MPSNILDDYAKTTQLVCAFLSVAVLLVIIFVLSPLKNNRLLFWFGKALIVGLLAFVIYLNTINTWRFQQGQGVQLFTGGWNTEKTNIAGSYVFSLLLLWLLVTTFRKSAFVTTSL